MSQNNIRNSPGMSAYFRGEYRHYGRYQWNIKYYDWKDDSEIEAAQYWAFGDYFYSSQSLEMINEVVGRKVKASISGRSGGWLVIHEELTDDELARIDEHVDACMKGLPEFLKEERESKAELERAANADEERRTAELNNDPRVIEIKRLVNEVVGSDAVLMLKGIRII